MLMPSACVWRQQPLFDAPAVQLAPAALWLLLWASVSVLRVPLQQQQLHSLYTAFLAVLIGIGCGRAAAAKAVACMQGPVQQLKSCCLAPHK